MKLKPTPTSPKVKLAERSEDLTRLYQDEGFRRLEHPQASPRRSVGIIILTLILALIAGAIGGFVLNVYLLDEQGPLGRIVSPNLSQTTSATRSRQARSVHEALEDVGKALLAIYDVKPSTGTLIDDAYANSEQRGSALILSEDGWAVTTDDVVPAEGTFAAVTVDRKALAVKHRVDDPASNMVFFQIDGGNFPVVALATPFELDVADPVWAVVGSGRASGQRARPLTVEETHAPIAGVLESSDEFSRVVFLNDTLPQVYRGSALLDARGQVVGVVGEVDESGRAAAWPAGVVRPVVDGLLREAAVKRPALGVRFIDVATVPGIPEAVRFRHSEGALVTGTTEEPALTPGSAAAGAGVASGDLIRKVNRDQLSEFLNLNEALLTYAPGDSITLGIVRDGAEQEIRVTFGEQ